MTVGRALLALLLVALIIPSHRSIAQAGPATIARHEIGTATVVSAGPAVRFSRLIAMRDDLYVIDAASEDVIRYILHGLPYAELYTQVLRWREGDNGLIIGRPLDLAAAGDRLLILDDRGTLWGYWGPTYARTVLPLRLQRDQGDVMAMALRGRRLMLVDPGRGQLWDYSAGARGFDVAPRRLLPRPWRRLASATRLAAGRTGAMVLLAGGALVAVPPARSGRAGVMMPGESITGICAAANGARFLVSTRHTVAVAAPTGAVLWRADVRGLGAESIVDVAEGPSGTVYVLTPGRILRLRSRVPDL